MRDVSLFQNVQTNPGAHLPYCPMGTRILSVGCSVDYSPLNSAKVKMLGSVPPLPHFSFHAQGQLYFFPVW